MPIVATVRMSRGALANRRMMRNSTSAPRTRPSPRQIGNDAYHDQCRKLIRSAHRMPGTAPRPAHAKFTIRLVR